VAGRPQRCPSNGWKAGHLLGGCGSRQAFTPKQVTFARRSSPAGADSGVCRPSHPPEQRNRRRSARILPTAEPDYYCDARGGGKFPRPKNVAQAKKVVREKSASRTTKRLAQEKQDYRRASVLPCPESATQKPRGSESRVPGRARSPVVLSRVGIRHSQRSDRLPHVRVRRRIVPGVRKSPISRPQPSHRKAVPTILTRRPPESEILVETAHILTDVTITAAIRGS
jgi:hypothetical protein